MAFKHAIALTGGISSGKSTVVNLLKKAGFEVIDADKVAHTVLEEEQEAIVKMFGAAMLKEGKVDRKALGALVFEDSEKRKALESLLHPRIYERIASLSDTLDEKGAFYIVDIPLFYESGRYAIENVIVVYAKQAQQLERMMIRDGFSPEEALSRLEAQLDIETKRKRAKYVIDNTGTLAQLQENTEEILHKILEEMQS